MGRRNADKDLRSNACDTAQKVLIPHPRINQDDRSPQLEQGKGQTDKISRRPDHEHHPLTRLHPLRLKIPGQTVGATVELGKRPMFAGGRLNEADLTCLIARPFGQGLSDIDTHLPVSVAAGVSAKLLVKNVSSNTLISGKASSST